MTIKTFTVMSGETYEVTAANAERAREVFLIEYGYEDGELIAGETCGHGDGETVVLPDTAPVDALLTALDAVGWILDNWYAAQDDENDDLLAIDALWAAAAAIRKDVN